MASSMWRMNGFCRSMAGVLLLYTLLCSCEVMGQDPETVAPVSNDTVASEGGETDAATPSAAATRTSTASAKIISTTDNNATTSSNPTNATSSSSRSVFVGILVPGLLVATGIIVWYFKCQRKPDAKGAKLAEKAYAVDQENQGNTLVSEAPLYPPPETQEKPNVNGESPEADKTPTSPPTNGHSTAKTADTQL